MKFTALFHIIETANLLYADEFGLNGDEITIYIEDKPYGTFRNFQDFSVTMNQEFVPAFVNYLLDCDLHSRIPYQLSGEFRFFNHIYNVSIHIGRF